ncbi:MAG: FtsW/RodA/SpoVE family cell cycle protein, partial [Hyphomicrobiales bacterium]
MRLDRTDRSLLSDWWFTIDRMLLTAVLLLMFAGVILSLAASPPVAERLGLDSFHFVRRHLVILGVSMLLLVSASMLSPRLIRRASLIMFLGGMVLMVLTLRFGPEIKGATRWIQVAGFSIQPSEFVKPAFVILSAWLFSEGQKRSDVPVLPIAFG